MKGRQLRVYCCSVRHTFGNNRNENVEADQRCDTKGPREIRRYVEVENITLKASKPGFCGMDTFCGWMTEMR